MGAAPSFRGLRSTSELASRVKKANKASDTLPELRLRKALTAHGARYHLHAASLPGKPDIEFPSARLAVICDGDFWHGRNWSARRKRLLRGANPDYWIAKIQSNLRRDRLSSNALR